MTAKSKRTTRVLLPTGAADVEYDDADKPAAYDDELAADLLEAAHKYEDEHGELAPGRPSLTAPGTHSPHVSFRVPSELAERLDEASAAEGVSRSVLARRALAAYLSGHRSA